MPSLSILLKTHVEKHFLKFVFMYQNYIIHQYCCNNCLSISWDLGGGPVLALCWKSFSDAIIRTRLYLIWDFSLVSLGSIIHVGRAKLVKLLKIRNLGKERKWRKFRFYYALIAIIPDVNVKCILLWKGWMLIQLAFWVFCRKWTIWRIHSASLLILCIFVCVNWWTLFNCLQFILL